MALRPAYKFAFYLLLGAAFLMPSVSSAEDKDNTNKTPSDKPVVVELYSATGCGIDEVMQKRLFHILQTYQGAVLLNCRIGAFTEDTTRRNKYRHQFCDERNIAYFHKLKMLGLKNVHVVVNGKYDAVNDDILSAVKMALSVDTISPMTVTQNEGAIDIEINKASLPQKYKSGEIHIYTYAPTHLDTIRVAPEEPKTGNQLPKTEPFESKPKTYTDYYLRPILQVTKIADWDGNDIKLSYPLPPPATFEFAAHDLSYVVTLTAGYKGAGDVIAIGEVKSSKLIEAESKIPVAKE